MGEMESRAACFAAWQANASAPMLTFVDDERGCGLGCRFLRLTAAFIAALDAEAILGLSPASSWYYAGDCGAGGHECYFDRLTPRASNVSLSLGARRHSHPDEWAGPGPLVGARAVFTRGSLDKFWAAYRTRRGRLAGHACLRGVADPCEQSAAAAAYVLRPNGFLRGEVAKVSTPPSPFVAMHVRHGDKAAERAAGAREAQLGDFVDRAASAFPEARHVWLMTEDPAVVAETARFPNLTFHYTAFDRTNRPEHGLAPGDARRLAVNSLVNLFVAIRAAGFVGADDSTWFRLLVVLAWGATGTKPRVARLGPSGFWRKGGLGSCFWLPNALDAASGG